jgi:hypothetical protein
VTSALARSSRLAAVKPAGAGSLGTLLHPQHVFDCLGDGVQVADHGDQLVAARLSFQLAGAGAGVLLSSAEQIHADN